MSIKSQKLLYNRVFLWIPGLLPGGVDVQEIDGWKNSRREAVRKIRRIFPGVIEAPNTPWPLSMLPSNFILPPGISILDTDSVWIVYRDGVMFATLWKWKQNKINTLMNFSKSWRQQTPVAELLYRLVAEIERLRGEAPFTPTSK